MSINGSSEEPQPIGSYTAYLHDNAIIPSAAPFTFQIAKQGDTMTLKFLSPTGISIYFMDDATATNIANALYKASTGLIVP